MNQDIEILQFLHYNPESTRAEIGSALSNAPSPATLKRLIADNVSNGHIEVIGRGPSTRYKLSPQAHVTMELNLDTYFDKDVDERQVQEIFNFELINNILPKVDLFTPDELEQLDEAQNLFHQHLAVVFRSPPPKSKMRDCRVNQIPNIAGYDKHISRHIQWQ